MAAQFNSLRSRMVVLPKDDVDTDQIIPARFLKVTDKLGLGEKLFSDWRYDEGGAPRPDFPLNRPDAAGCQVLVAGSNFGCGSSREHAPWALCGFGFRAVIARSFADIFRGNALKNGLLPIQVEADVQAALVAARQANPAVEVAVDLESRALTLPDGRVISFAVDEFARRCLLSGQDELAYLLSHSEAIAKYESARS